MKIVMIFDVQNDVYDEIMGMDMHAEDLCDLVNEHAREDEPIEVWHFSDGNGEELDGVINDLFIEKEMEKNMTYQKLVENHDPDL